MTIGVDLQDKILYKVFTSLSLFLRVDLLGFMYQSLLAPYFVLRNEKKIDTIMKLIDPQSGSNI